MVHKISTKITFKSTYTTQQRSLMHCHASAVRCWTQVKGWIDVTYLSERLRIARGNKGTLFVLQRPDALRESSSA